MAYQSGFRPSSAYSSTTLPPAPSDSLPARPPRPENPYPATHTSRGGWQTTTYAPSASAGYYSQQAYNGYANSPAQGYGPFVSPAGGKPFGNGYDPEAAAQVQQWQSAYVNKDDALKAGKSAPAVTPISIGPRPIGPRPIGPVLTANDEDSTGHDGADYASAANTDKGVKTVIRAGGGKQWTDPSLLEWDPNHPRLFVGNLAGEVTDESLFKAFSKYPSLVKARVVREKRTTKSRGYGFVSFSDSDEYFKAAREMEGKYIGSHPVQISRAETKMKIVSKKKADAKLHGKPKTKPKKDKIVSEVDQDVYEDDVIMEPEYAGNYDGYAGEWKPTTVSAPKTPSTKIGGHANTGAGVKKNRKEKGKKDKGSSSMRVLG